ncbi:MAG: hypothetical protein ABIH87_03520 [bacterium]
MKLLKKYQLDIIFLFFALILIVWTVFYILKNLGQDPHDYEWLVSGPLLLFYLIFSLCMRAKIKLSERKNLTGKSLVYWIILGVALFNSYATPISARDYWSVNAFFLAFTLLLADSYWDFKDIKLKKSL